MDLLLVVIKALILSATFVRNDKVIENAISLH